MNFDILRQKILEKAIRGELVPQLESEPEVVQIDRCLANAPFSIPKKWRWAYFSDVIDLISGRDLEKDKILTVNNGIPYITGASQIQDGNIIVNRWTEHPIVVSKKGDILLTCKGTIGKIAQNNIGEIHIARQIMAIRPSEKISIGYITYFLYYVKNFLVEKAKSMIPGIDRKTLLSMPIPLPPIEEQHRITIRLEGLFKYLSCAEKSFADLLTFTKIIKNRVLNKAIRGRLVPQLESELCIELPDSQLSDSTIDIPKKWKWVKLKDIFTFIDYRGKTPNKIHEGVRLITASNVKQGRMDHSKKVFISNEEYLTRQSRGISKKGDILFTTEAPLGKVAIADIDNYSAGQRIITLQSKKGNNKLYMYFMLSPYFQKRLVSQATGTTAQGIKAARLKELVIPVPPEGEQERILNKLTALFSFLEIYK